MENGATVLETLRDHGIPHASVCGGRGRCTTCRVRVIHGLEHLPDIGRTEEKALERIGAPANLRLACQLRPRGDLGVVPLLPPSATAADGRQSGGMEGSERLITVLFVDLRDSTRLGERKLPYDVLFILNQFLMEMNGALVETGGRLSQFIGDGLMALYGLDTDDPGRGCRDALRGAAEMLRRLDNLNANLESELENPLRAGIGIHFGEAIVGEMGLPGSQVLTAIGDNVNIAARLEGLTKEFNVPLVISAELAETAEVTCPVDKGHNVTVSGRSGPVQVYALDEPPEPTAG